MKAQTLARKMGARKGRPAPTLVPRYEVVGVNPDEHIAVLQRPDGSEFEVYTMDGTLPALGDVVPVQSNGGDPFVLSTRVLVEGTRQSSNYLAGTSGWFIGADGNVEFNDGVFRGAVTGNLFRTAESGARVEISAAEVRSVRYYTGKAGEITPGTTQSYDDATMAVVEMTSPTFNLGGTNKFSRFRVGVDFSTNTTFADLDGDDLRVLGVSISTPPFSMKRLLGQSFTSSSSGFQAVLFDADHLVHHLSAISYSGTGTWSIFRPGIYDLFGTLAWQDDTVNTGSREIRVVEDGSERVLDSRNFVTGRRTVHNFHDTIIAPGDTSLINPWTVQLKASQHNTTSGGTGLTLTGRASIGRRSGVSLTWTPP